MPPWHPVGENPVEVRYVPVEGTIEHRISDCGNKGTSCMAREDGETCTDWNRNNTDGHAVSISRHQSEEFEGSAPVESIPPYQRREYAAGYPRTDMEMPNERRFFVEEENVRMEDSDSASFVTAHEGPPDRAEAEYAFEGEDKVTPLDPLVQRS